jgi:transposase-like protein
VFYRLACNFERFVTTEELMLFTWHDDNEPEDAYANVTVHICNLRKKLKAIDLRIASATGYGYRLVEADAKGVHTIRYTKSGRRSKPWTLEEKKTMVSMARDGHDILSIARAIGRSDTAVRRKLLYEFDLPDVPSDHNARPWTEEDDTLMTSMADRPVEEIAKALDRGEIAVRSRLYYRRLRGHGQTPNGRCKRA